MVSYMEIGLFIVIMIPVFLSMVFIPYWTRKTESFGVSIPEGVYQLPKVKDLRKRYAIITGVLSVIVLLGYLIISLISGGNENTLSIVFTVIIFLYLLLSFGVYLKFHYKMKVWKAESDWGENKLQKVVINTQFRTEKLTYSNLWFMVPFVISLVTIMFVFRQYDQLPDKLPMNYDFSGHVTRWAEKSYRTLMMLPILQVYMTFLFIFINTLIKKAKQQVSAERPEESMKQNIIFRKRWSLYMIVLSIAITLMFSTIELTFNYPSLVGFMGILSAVITAVILIGALWLSFSTGQGGSRVTLSNTVNANKDGGGHSTSIDRDDDRYWKLGQIYFNRHDPSLFVEKRFGIGWTINFARPLAISIFLIIIILAFLLPILFTGHFHFNV